jgi:hypothetical protein
MRRAAADAIADLRTTFPERNVVVEDLDDGHAWVTLVGVGIGDGWNRETDDVSVKLQPTFPDTEPYPFVRERRLQLHRAVPLLCERWSSSC